MCTILQYQVVEWASTRYMDMKELKRECSEESMRIEMNLFQHHGAKWMSVLLCGFGWLLLLSPLAVASHRGGEEHASSGAIDSEESTGHPIPGTSFQVYWGKSKVSVEDQMLAKSQEDETIQTVIDAFSELVAHRAQYKRFDEALTKRALQKVIIEPKVFNRDGKEFMFLVARTKHHGQVKLLINASALKEQGLVNHPDQLVPVLAQEFQWVVSKADTSKKPQVIASTRDLQHAPIQTRKEIDNSTGDEREKTLQALFESYLTTVDEYNSLQQQPYYEIGSESPVPSAQADSTTKLYDIRAREALQRIVREPYFYEHTTKGVRSLLNGKVWNVAFTHIDSRDWATRTRVLPKDKAVKVGKQGKMIQPAKILINLHRKASPDDPYYDLTKDLPMGALSTDQLAQVIALEIENQIIEKSMRGHVAADEESAPQ
jgi:hypothetical protein